ncbi:MAG TPA: hypothetical protein VJL10_11215 [Anaerolineales bacterium]|nr:hypothetical protein [Candidatus Hodarchaeales archaeon]HLA88586.1 hypothetical protein [Anaerolineales bacterium]
MAFRRVWDVGGYVFSELVHKMGESRDLTLLNPGRPDHSYFIRKQDYAYQDRYKQQFGQDGEKAKYIFTAGTRVGNNTVLREYGFDRDTTPFFTSRYYPADFKSILSTYCILKEFDYSFTKYIIHVLKLLKDDENFLRKLLFSLYLLSYFDIGQQTAEGIDFDKTLKDGYDRANRVRSIVESKQLFELAFDDFIKKDIVFKQKRAWCSLRDFLKSPEFSGYFKASLINLKYGAADALFDQKNFTQLELPGDVWNNNSKFRNCILTGTGYEHSRLSFAKLLREVFDKNRDQISKGYPEQFDVTFDLVPRMCEQNNCKICPYGLLNGKASDFMRVCTNQGDRYCPALLAACNYKRFCAGEGCTLLAISRGRFG